MIVLMGFMGAGKTTIGYLLAEKLGIPFVDIDILIEQRFKRAVKDIFAEEGEAYFRDLEHKTIVETVSGPEAVVALGGGAVEHPGTRIALTAVTAIHLEVSYEEALLRIGNDAYRPMMAQPDVRNIYEKRLPVYRRSATLPIRTDRRRPEDIVLEIISKVTTPASVPEGTRSILVAPMGGAHQVHIGKGLASQIGSLLPPVAAAKNAFFVARTTDLAAARRMASELAERGELQCHVLEIPDGEVAKSFQVAEAVTEALAARSAHGEDFLVGVGGEAACYLSGFVAATYNRGMRLVLIPTTLHGQADAAIGGKNGINLTRGQNLVGTLHQPVVVISDVMLGLANREDGFLSGLAEMAKHAFIADDTLAEILESQARALLGGDADQLVAALARSTQVKAAIVTSDEREQGERLKLNYGHTFGHAFEQVLPAGPDSHGRAVSLGMMAAAHLAHHLGRIPRSTVRRHGAMLNNLELPTTHDFSIEELQGAWKSNKKYRDSLRFILLNDDGGIQGGVEATEEDLRGALDALARGWR